MRLGTIALGVLFPAASILTGCGVGKLATSSAASATSTTSAGSRLIRGKAFGGQQPVTQSSIDLYAFGNTGYGSTGTLIASSSTDENGYFTIDPAAIDCNAAGITPDTPVYILSIGGNPGSQPNSAIALGASLGTCARASDPNTFVTINEISTAMLAYTFSRFFSAANADGVTSDHFGSPLTAAQVISNASSGTIPTLLDTTNGYPQASTATLTFEGSKLITLANILGACVNSVGPKAPSCSGLFRYSTPSGGTAPTNTLEAAVYIAQNPSQNIARLYALQPQSGAAAFTGGLTSAPADWTLSASYTSPAFGLAVDASTVSTIDIDASGRVWFPSNRDRANGAGYFDPSTGSFSPLFIAHVSHPQQLAIDADGYAWVNDSVSSYVAGFLTSDPTRPRQLSLASTTSNSVTIGTDGRPRFGIKAGSGLPALAVVSAKTYFDEVANTEISGDGNFIASSVAADPNGGIALGGQNLNRAASRDYYFDVNNTRTPVLNHTQDAGQLVLTSTDYVQARGGYAATQDGLCFYSIQTCYRMAVRGQRHPAGMSIDGSGTLWLADIDTSTIEAVPFSNGSYLTAAGDTVNNVLYTHDSANGGTLVGPAGIAVDGAGNVWVSNYGCYGNGCTPGSFTLTEVLGAGAPTLTPISASVITPSAVATAARQDAARNAH